MATPVESERKSWPLTGRGDRSQREPGFLKLPTSSRFLVSTLMMGRATALEALAKIAQIKELIVAVGAKVGEVLHRRAGTAHLIAEWRRATVLGPTPTPKSPNAMAIFFVVRRDHFSPVMGSPAVSYSSTNSISVTMSAKFFDWFASAAGTACGPSIHSDRAVVGVRERRCPGPGRGTRPEMLSPPCPSLDGFQPGKQTTLLLVEQAVEQDGCFQFIGRYLESGIGQERNRLGDLLGAEGRAPGFLPLAEV